MRPDTPMRDLLLMFPPDPSLADVYREHQAVWRELVRIGMPAEHGQAAPFLFARDGDLVRVRATHPFLQAPLARPICEGRLRLRLLAERSPKEGSARVVEPNAIADFADTLLRRQGFRASAIEVAGAHVLTGIKGEHPIRLRTVDLMLRGRFDSPALAQRAWACGIGRAKRFGCGMLHAA
jgi:hypothetical protein